MTSDFVPFDDIRERVVNAVSASDPIPDKVGAVYIVRNLYGKVRISVSDTVENDESCRAALQCLASRLHEVLAAHGVSPDRNGVLFVDPSLLADIRTVARELPRPGEAGPGVYLVDRLVTASDWWTVGDAGSPGNAKRYTLYSVKGGLGRSTTAAVLARHLAGKGRRALVVDMDLESPGLSSAVLEPERQPDFGVTDWFVEALAGQDEQVLGRMTAAPRWAQDFDGDVRVAPAHGRKSGEYLAKLGRVYMDTAEQPWTARLGRLLDGLEADAAPDVVLLESRSGLHDIAAAAVCHVDAQVLLFATDSESNWTDYEVLFRHWRDHDLARRIRERLRVVSALTPEIGTEEYLERFRERAWNLFRDHLYDKSGASDDSDSFSFDLHDDDAPHVPFSIHWNRGLAAGASLRDLEQSAVRQAYARFLDRFDGLSRAGGDGDD